MLYSITSMAAVLACLGLLYGALLRRGVDALAHLESEELDRTGRALPWVVPLVAALLGAWLVRRGDRKPPVARATLIAGALAGALSAAVPLSIEALRVGRGGNAVLGLSAIAAVAGALLALPAIAAVRLALERRGKRLLHATAALSAVAGAVLWLLAPPRARPETALASRTPTPKPTWRGTPGEEPPEVKKKQVVADTVDQLAGALERAAHAEIERIVVDAKNQDALRDVFSTIVDKGLYDAMESRLRGLPHDSPALKALVEARPTYGADELNADAIKSIRERRDWEQYPFALIIVPGYTPVKANKPLAVKEIDAAMRRLDLAVEDWQHKGAPYILVSGGSVHPAGTPHNEALAMRDYLLDRKVPPECILVDPFARHSTTNLRNAGRLMRDLGMKNAVIVTGFESSPFDQAFYFSYPILSTFAVRSRRELGFQVGKLRGLDSHRIEFTPAAEVAKVNLFDPLDA
jgi:hypothetical protein